MKKTTVSIPKMDCAAEERLVRMALEGRPGIHQLDADLGGRQLRVVHEGDANELVAHLRPLNLGGEILDTIDAPELDDTSTPSGAEEARTLKVVLAINAGMFAAEMAGAILADSSALLADSLDMGADAAVYAMALFGVHRARAGQLKAARLSGILQLLLAIGALSEVGRRLLYGSEPQESLMVLVALAALVANISCMWLLARHRHGGAHMKASWIFTTNDVIANLGVVVAAGLVRLFQSNLPDLAVATVIAIVVLNGARRILNLKA
jgi:Co/Zn/Cd efflux system component